MRCVPLGGYRLVTQRMLCIIVYVLANCSMKFQGLYIVQLKYPELLYKSYKLRYIYADIYTQV